MAYWIQPGTTGANVLLITYDLVATSAVQPLQTLTNTATLTNFAGAEGGPDHIDHRSD